MNLGNRSSITTGQVPVPVAGTPVPLPNIPVPDGFAVRVIAGFNNANRIFYGGTVAEALAHTANLDAEDWETFYVNNLNEIWIDALVNGDLVNYKVVQ